MISLFGYLIRNWRYLHLTAAIFSTHLLFFFLIIPESPRWLLTKGYKVKARKIITKVAEVNKKIISEAVINTIKVPANITTAKFWKLCSTKKRCLRTFVIYFMWFATSVTYFGIMLNLESLVGDIYLNLVLATIVEAVCVIVVLLTVERLGRKRLLCGCFLLGSIALIAVILIILYTPPDVKWLITCFTLLGQCGINGAFALCWLWTSELFPTELRNVGTGTSSASARIGSVVAPYLKLLGSLMPGRFEEVSPFILFCIVCIIALVLTLFLLPETFHQNLPDTVEDAERLGDGSGDAVDEKELAASMLGTEVNGDASLVI
ncbi:organic cation transporter protein [Patella vulgata]|uniref:organic cation transporter protein n=1 Tax=Patella vulgata TaxID=6465 RepID=UPI0024A8DFAA|nr:organic cation transporter protein [Patella vulgata]